LHKFFVGKKNVSRKTDFPLETIIITMVTCWWKCDYYSNVSADAWTTRYMY